MNYIKFSALLLFFICTVSQAFAQDEVYFEIDRNDGLAPTVPAERVERNISKLLTAMNRAASENSSSIDFAGIEISDEAAMSLMLIWENVRMRTLDDDIMRNIINLGSRNNVRGYEVQNIGVEMMPMHPDEFTEPRIQEVTISIDRQGRISDFVVSMGMHQYSTMMKGAVTLDDIDQRQQILHFVEQFRTAYIKKDKQFLEDIFSDDALIIIGHVRQRTSLESGIATVVEYTKKSKREYLSALFKNFDRPRSYINVIFKDIEVERDPLHDYIYGVTLRQEWYSNTYSDVGTVFLLWDFSNKDKPKIYVRTWQPNEDTHRFTTTEFNF